ncbi:RagB/SusD family nutrient uptake outer membrane protein [Paraflavitalea pollutisoli]|uniref:RagB/SusD family nutrient uptake outer membrane protein n=1 Tax=Paraflavitalea pollutisoli TaxID=3034143 RepID=UPI0023EBFFEA|nr:RagB/SusD family nutrient uptake outer membrane protein [Paraflavitalea sp. H1-2-19X]
MRINTAKKIVLASLVALASCKKLDLAPSDRFTELNFWQSSENVNNALNNVYGGMYTSQPFFYNEALSDNAFTKLGINSGQPDAIASGNFTSSLPRFQNDWANYYGGIKSCNIFLENVDQNTTLSEAVKNRMKGETRFIRAFHHFNLTKWWGDVPILSKDITPDEAKTVSRSPKAEVVKFVLDELDAAAAALPAKEQYAAGDHGRITKGAALALKARVLLYEVNRMAEVVTVCEQLINNGAQNGNYSLAASYTDLFSGSALNKNNTETILSLQYVPALRMWGDYIDFAPISAGARSNNLAPTQELVNNYLMLNGKQITEAGSGYDEANPYANRDPRLSATVVYDRYNWVNPNGTSQTIYIKPGTAPAGQTANEYSAAGQGTATGYYWRKYWDPAFVAPGISSGLNIHLIRYAEVLLMYAEAKQALGQMTEEVWNKTIKALRQRAGFTDAGALNYPGNTNMTDIIRAERRTELVMEGIRIDDIRRWKIAETVLNGWAHGAKFGEASIDNGYLRVQLRQFDKSKHYLWPVPPSERALNTNLSQNDGY